MKDMEATVAEADSAASTDAQRVEAAMRGDQRAFSELYQAHAGRLMTALWRLSGGDRGLAEDWLQDAFVQAWNKLSQLREPAAFGGWLKRLAINVALSEKRRGRLNSVDSEVEARAPEPPWPAADLDLERAIARLPERSRQVLVLFHLSDMGHAEIAELMGIEQGTSKAQLHRARTLLKEMLA